MIICKGGKEMYCYKDKKRKSKDDGFCELSYYRKVLNRAREKENFLGLEDRGSDEHCSPYRKMLRNRMSKSYFSSGSKHNSSQDDSDDDIMSFEEFEKMISEYGPDSSEDKTSENTANKPNKDAVKENDVKVHYNSPEPEKFGAKAFTKDGEVYLAPGEEDSLNHELVHIYQQKNKNIPATGEIHGQKVNTDPKLEKEADEGTNNLYNLENIETQESKTNDVMQMRPGETNKTRIRKKAGKLGINEFLSKNTLNKIFNKCNKYEPSLLSTTGTKENVLVPELKKIKDIIDRFISKGIRSDLLTAEYIDNILEKIDKKNFYQKTSTVIDQEIERIKNLFSECVFKKSKTFPNDVKLSEIIHFLSPYNKGQVLKCINKLRQFSDNEGIIAVIRSANINVQESFILLDISNPNHNPNSNKAKNKEDCFVERLMLMEKYIEKIANQKDADGKNFGEKYWIRSTGSDPHQNGQHALFFVNKENQEGYRDDKRMKKGEIACVYKPHDLSADNAVVGERGIFANVNDLIRDSYKRKCEELSISLENNQDALATMKINLKNNTEELVKKEDRMSIKQAQLYFFRMGILKAITDSMAVIDLHCENIMSTQNGPVIIDAEINFFHYTEGSSLAVGKDNALKTQEYKDSTFELTNNDGMYINMKGELIDPKSQDPLLSSVAFDSDEDNLKLKNYYESGYAFMCKTMDDNVSKFVEIFKKQLGEINNKIRIIPLRTPRFALYLNDVIEGKTKEDETAESLEKEIKDQFKEGCKFLDSKKTKVVFYEYEDENPLYKAILETLNNKTIPAMYADMQGNIYMDNTQVGEIVFKITDNDKGMEEGKKITKDQLIEIMKDCSLNIIKKNLGVYDENIVDENIPKA